GAKERPGLAAAPSVVPIPQRQAAGALGAAEADLGQRQRTWRGAALLQGVVARWEGTEAAARARKLLKEIEETPWRRAIWRDREGAEERRRLTAEARGRERLGDVAAALAAWEELRRRYPETPDGRDATAEAQRLREVPYLGLAFVGETTAVVQVVARGPSERAGVQAGDVL